MAMRVRHGITGTRWNCSECSESRFRLRLVSTTAVLTMAEASLQRLSRGLIIPVQRRTRASAIDATMDGRYLGNGASASKPLVVK
jgi:hypothetical protein